MRPLYELTPWEEHLFWLEILQDHAYFVYQALAPEEVDKIRTAGAFIHEFGRLLEGLRQLPPELDASDPRMVRYAQDALTVSRSYYDFEGHLQHLRIQNQVVLSLSPTFLNGTLSENREYLRLLEGYAAGLAPPPLPMVDLVDLWLDDQLGHVVLLMNYLDPAETVWMERLRHYQSAFAGLAAKHHQLRQYLKFTPAGFPVQRQFATEVTSAVYGFTQVVQQVTALYLGNKVLNRFTLRFIEHHFPETCYFLRKLVRYAPEIPVQPCSLVKPSFGPNNQPR